MNCTIKLTAIALALGITISAQATDLPYRSIYGGSIDGFDIVAAPFGGTLLQSMSVQYEAGPVSGPVSWGSGLNPPAIISGTFNSAVYENSAGTMDFYYQIANIKGVPNGGIWRAVDLDIANFGNLGGAQGSIQGNGPPDWSGWSIVGSSPGAPLSIFQTSAAFGIFSVGTVAGIGAARETGAWAGGNLGGVAPGSSNGTDIHIGLAQDMGTLTDASTFTEIIRTNLTSKIVDSNGLVIGLGFTTGKNALGIGDVAEHKDLGFVGHQTYSGVDAIVPSVPEPESYALLLAGLGLIGGVFRRRKTKQKSSAMSTAAEGLLV